MIIKNKTKSIFVTNLFRFVLIIALFALVQVLRTPVTSAATGVNEQLNFQGRLLDSTGAVVADGSYNMEFKVVQDGDGCNPTSGTFPCSGTVMWTETRIQTNRVTVTNGYFSVNLGSVTAFASSVDWNQSTLWLSVNIGGTANTPSPTWDGAMKPLKRLTASPYALNALKLGGLSSSAFGQLASSNTWTQTNNFTGTTTFSGTTTTLKNVLLSQGANRTLGVETNASNADGYDLTISAGNAGGGASQFTGGNVYLYGGDGAGGIGGTAGSTYVDSGINGFSAGSVFIGNTYAEGVTIGRSTGTTGTNVYGTYITINAGQTLSLLTSTSGTALTVGNTTSNPNISFVGNGTFGTTTGAVGLNGNVTVASGKTLTVAGTGNTTLGGDLAVNGGDITSSGALAITSGGSSGLTIDSASGIVTVSAGDVLKLGTNAGDPTCTAGSLVYNTSTNKLRGCEGSSPAWADVVSTGGGGGTLQTSYDTTSGNTITTTDARNISFTLADTTTDSNFLVNIASGSTAGFEVQSNGTDIFSVNSTAAMIGAQADASAGTTTTLTNSAAGTFGSETGRDGAYSSITFNGKMYISTKENDLSSVYRYDGGTTWTRVSDSTPGKIISGDAAAIDYSVLSVYNGKLYALTYNQLGATLCTANTNCAALYSYDGSTWTLVNSARGTFGAQTLVMGGSELQVCAGRLFVGVIGTATTNTAMIYRYDGGSTFTAMNATAGKMLAEATAQIDGFNMVCYGGSLIVGTLTGSATNTARVYKQVGGTDANTTLGTTWLQLNHATSGSGGTFGSQTNIDDVTSMTVFAGQLYVGTGEPNLASIYVFKGNIDRPTTVSTGTDWQLVTSTPGRIDSANDATDIDAIPVLRQYNGRLYAGSDTSAAGNLGGVYEFNLTTAAATAAWTRINSARGTFGSETNVDKVDTMMELNGLLYIGTEDSANSTAGVYSWYKNSSNSYALRFDSGGGNYGAISLVGSTQAGDNNGHMGSFLFSNPVMLGAGSFDYAEDYMTVDESLVAGEPVSVDKEHPEHVKRAQKGETVIGVVSESPGFRLSSDKDATEGSRWVPIALVGRVPVRVTTHGGASPIQAGDALAISDDPGVLERAVEGSGAVVGTALTGYSGAEDTKLTLFVQPSLRSIAGNMNTQDIQNILKKSSITEPLTLTSGSDELADMFVLKNKAGEQIMRVDNQGNVSLTGTLTADKVKAKQIEGMEVYTDQLRSLSEKVNAETEQPATSNDTPALGEQLLSIGNVTLKTVTVQLDLNVLGSLTASGALTVKGDATFEGLVAFNNRVTFDSDTAGFASIMPGKQEVAIDFNKPYDSSPSISVSIKNGVFAQYVYIETKQTDPSLPNYGKVTGFVIKLKDPATEQVDFSWTALQVKSSRTSVSSL